MRCWQWADEGGRPTNRGSLLMDATLPLDQPALPTGAACSWTQHCRWTNLPYQPGSLLMDVTLPLDQPALPTGAACAWTQTLPLDQPALPTGAACSWTQHCRWTNLPYQPGQPAHGRKTAAGPTCPTNRGSLLMDATLPLDQPALPTGQPAHGRNTAAGPTCPTNRGSLRMDANAAAGPTCPTNRGSLLMDATLPLDQPALPTGAACSWTQDCRWTNLPYQPGQPAHGRNTAAGPTCPTNRGSLLMDATLPLDQPALPTGAACSWTQHCRWTNLPYQPGQPAHGRNTAAGPTCPTNRGSLLMDATLPLDQPALPTGAACAWTQHCRWTNLPYQPGQPAHGRNTAAGPTCPTNRDSLHMDATLPLDQLALPTGAACSWTQHCHWTNLPYQPGQPAHGRNTAAGPTCPTNRGSLLMDATLQLDQPALPTGQPAHGRNTAAGPTCPTNRGSLLM